MPILLDDFDDDERVAESRNQGLSNGGSQSTGAAVVNEVNGVVAVNQGDAIRDGNIGEVAEEGQGRGERGGGEGVEGFQEQQLSEDEHMNSMIRNYESDDSTVAEQGEGDDDAYDDDDYHDDGMSEALSVPLRRWPNWKAAELDS